MVFRAQEARSRVQRVCKDLPDAKVGLVLKDPEQLFKVRRVLRALQAVLENTVIKVQMELNKGQPAWLVLRDTLVVRDSRDRVLRHKARQALRDLRDIEEANQDIWAPVVDSKARRVLRDLRGTEEMHPDTQVRAVALKVRQALRDLRDTEVAMAIKDLAERPRALRVCKVQQAALVFPDILE